MIKSDKKLKEFSAILEKGDNDTIVDAIIALRDEQPFSGVIGILAGQYDRSDNNEVRKTIENFMNDLKDPSVCPEVIATIKREWKDSTVSMLVASCWQSGLDYSEYAKDIAKVYMEGDYITAIECLTVLEASSGTLDHSKKEEIISQLQNGTFRDAAEKRELTLELISVMNSL